MDESFFKSAPFLISRLVRKFCHNEICAEKYYDYFRDYNVDNGGISSGIIISQWISDMQMNGNGDNVEKILMIIKMMYKLMKNPEKFLILYDLLIRDKPILMISDIDENHLYSDDFLLVMQGINGERFKWSAASKRFEYNGYIDEKWHSFIQTVSQIGTLVKYIEEMKPSESLFYQKAYAYVQSIIDMHNKILSQFKLMKADYRTALPKYFLDSNTTDVLKSAYLVLSSIYRKKGGELLNSLISYHNHGDPVVISVSDGIYSSVTEVLNDMIMEWALKGLLEDPFNEFFISSDVGVFQCSEWWKKKFFIVESNIPASLSSKQIEMVFYSGKIQCFFNTFVTNNYIRDYNRADLIESSYNINNSMILSLLLKNNKLEKMYFDIHNYLFLEKGDFALSFIMASNETKKSNLRTLFHEYSKNTVDGVEVRLTDEGWGFVYNVANPHSVLFNNEDLSTYKQVSGMMLKLKTLEYKLMTFRQTFKKEKQYIKLVFLMSQFLRLVLSYFHINVLERALGDITNFLKNPCSLDSLLSIQKTHTSRIARGCWITKSGKGSRDALEAVLNVIMDALEFKKSHNEMYNSFVNSLKQFRIAIRDNSSSGQELFKQFSRHFENYLF